MMVKYGILVIIETSDTYSLTERNNISGLLLTKSKTSNELIIRTFSSLYHCEQYIETIYRAFLNNFDKKTEKIIRKISLFPSIVIIDDNKKLNKTYLNIIGLNDLNTVNTSDVIKRREYLPEDILDKNFKYNRVGFNEQKSLLYNLNLFTVRKLALTKLIPFNYIPGDIIRNHKESLVKGKLIPYNELNDVEKEIRNLILTQKFDIWDFDLNNY